MFNVRIKNACNICEHLNVFKHHYDLGKIRNEI